MAFNQIICQDGAPIVCAEAMRDMLLDCSMRKASEFWDSGVINRSARAATFAEGCYKATQYRHWLPVEYSEGAIVSCGLNDAPGDEDCPGCEGLSQTTETLFKLYSRKCWGMDYCETQCMGCDEDNVIDIVVQNVVTPYMVRDNVEKMFSELVGLYTWASAAAPEIQGEMILDLEGNALDSCAGIDLNTLRDCGSFDKLFVHRDEYIKMRKNGCLAEKVCCGDLEFEFDALQDGTAVIPVPRQIADVYLRDADGCYVSFAVNDNAFEYAEGCHPAPVERDRDPAANCGDGAEKIYFRREFVLRPYATEFDTTNLARDYASHAELQDGNRWNVTIPLEFFGIGFVKSSCPA